MNKPLVISVLLFFLIGSAFGQQFKAINDSLELERFHSYVHTVLSMTKDSALSYSPSSQYEYVYRTSCRNEEVLYADTIFYRTEGQCFMTDSFSVNTKSRVFTHALASSANMTPFYCAKNPAKSIKREPFPLKKETVLTPSNLAIEHIYINDDYFEYDVYGVTVFSSCASFQHGKYVIIEFFLTRTIGNQTSLGITETLFLERIE